jgi:hypothetical protein
VPLLPGASQLPAISDILVVPTRNVEYVEEDSKNESTRICAKNLRIIYSIPKELAIDDQLILQIKDKVISNLTNLKTKRFVVDFVVAARSSRRIVECYVKLSPRMDTQFSASFQMSINNLPLELILVSTGSAKAAKLLQRGDFCIYHPHSLIQRNVDLDVVNLASAFSVEIALEFLRTHYPERALGNLDKTIKKLDIFGEDLVRNENYRFSSEIYFFLEQKGLAKQLPYNNVK